MIKLLFSTISDATKGWLRERKYKRSVFMDILYVILMIFSILLLIKHIRKAVSLFVIYCRVWASNAFLFTLRLFGYA
jgi:hypothetical protein